LACTVCAATQRNADGRSLSVNSVSPWGHAFVGVAKESVLMTCDCPRCGQCITNSSDGEVLLYECNSCNVLLVCVASTEFTNAKPLCEFALQNRIVACRLAAGQVVDAVEHVEFAMDMYSGT